MAKKTAGERWEPIDSKTATEAPLKSPAEIMDLLVEANKKAAEEKFPTKLTEAMQLLGQINSEPVSTHTEWLLKQPRLNAIKVHLFKLQQGLPVIHSTGNDPAYSLAARMGEKRTRLLIMARSNPAIKELLNERDSLARILDRSGTRELIATANRAKAIKLTEEAAELEKSAKTDAQKTVRNQKIALAAELTAESDLIFPITKTE